MLVLLFEVGCTGMSDFSRETYRKGFLLSDTVQAASIAVLPLASANQPNRYLIPAREIFQNVIQGMQPQIKPVSLSLSPTKDVLHTSEFAALKKEAHFLLQAELQQVEVVDGATQVRLLGRLWDIEQGEIIWEGIGESRGHLFLFFPTAPASFEKAMEVAARGLIRKLPVRP
jgi:hypothetical protein